MGTKKIDLLTSQIASRVRSRTGISLNGRECRILAGISRITGEKDSLLKFIKAYRGPREKLSRVLESRRQFLARAAESLIGESEIRAFLPTEQHRQYWDALVEKGWKFHFIRRKFYQEPGLAQAVIDEGAKTVNFRMSLEIDHPSLLFAYEIGRLAQLDAVNENREKLEPHLAMLLGDSSPRAIDGLLFLILEKDLRLQQLELYDALIRQDPDNRNHLWDKLNLEPASSAEYDVIRPYIWVAGLPGKVFSIIKGKSLIDFIAACGGNAASPACVVLKDMLTAVGEHASHALEAFRVTITTVDPRDLEPKVKAVSEQEVRSAGELLKAYAVYRKKARPTVFEFSMQTLAVTGAFISCVAFVPGMVTSIIFGGVVVLIFLSKCLDVHQRNTGPYKEEAKRVLREILQRYDEETINRAMNELELSDPRYHFFIKDKLTFLEL